MQFLGRVVLTAGALVCLTAGIAHAQTTSSATETKKFQVIAVDGSDRGSRRTAGRGTATGRSAAAGSRH